MRKYYLLREIEILSIGFLNFWLLRLVTVELILNKINNINIFLMIIKLSWIYLEQEIAHDVVTHERIITITSQIKILIGIILNNLLLHLAVQPERILIQFYSIYFQIVKVFVFDSRLFRLNQTWLLNIQRTFLIKILLVASIFHGDDSQPNLLLTNNFLIINIIFLRRSWLF